METVRFCGLSSAPLQSGGTALSFVYRSRIPCSIGPFYSSRHRPLVTKRCDGGCFYQQRIRFPSSLCIRAQSPIPSSDDNENSPEVSSRNVMESLQSEVSRVEHTPEPGPSKLRYGLLTGLAATGLVETAYLTWTKLYGGPVSCPLGDTGCDDVLNSEYGTVFGVPLSLVGMVAYGAVALIAGRMATNPKERIAEEEGFVRWMLLASTTAMAVASAYFMYILNIKLNGASCRYCVGSALLSVGLLFLTLVGFSSKDLRNVAGVQLAVGASVAVALSVAFNDISSAFAGSADIDLPPVAPEVTTVSSARELSLAKKLKAMGAKMYGAFWCSHCFEQKQMFGKEAMEYIEYVECYPEGYRRGVQIAKECDAANIQGFPTWTINGQQYSGEQDFEKLSQLSGLSVVGEVH